MWDFEETYLVNDGSGNMTEAADSLFSKVTRGPSFLGNYKAAYFDGNQYYSIDHNSNEFNSPVFTYSFWIFLIRDAVGSSKPTT